MATYVSKPVTIEAVQLTREFVIARLIDGNGVLPNGLTFRGEIRPQAREFIGNFVCMSMQGEVTANVDDWIIEERGYPSLCYPCNPEVFAAKYEPAP